MKLKRNFQFSTFQFIILFMLSGCNSSPSSQGGNLNWSSEISDSPETNQKIDFYKNKIKAYYSINPDSAIYYYHGIIDLYHAEKMVFNEFDAYKKLSELYSFRKSDGANAVFYYGEALKIMIKNNGLEGKDPFFHIDMGNMFYTNELFPQAIKSYQQAIQISLENKNFFAQSVALNNLGIIYRTTNNLDSASLFFHQALSIRKKIIPLYEAQNYMYLAKVFAFANIPDSILMYRNKAKEALERQSKLKLDPKVITVAAANALTKDMYVYDANIMAIYFKDKGNFKQSIFYYNLAKNRSIEVKDFLTAINYKYNIAIQYKLLGDNTKSIEFALDTYKEALKYNHLEYVVKATKLLGELYAQIRDLNKSNYYLLKSINYADSLKTDEISGHKQASRILLITTQTEESLRYFQYKEEQDRMVMKNQTLLILVLSLSVLFLILLLYYIHMKRIQSKKEHLKQMNEILRNIEREENLKIQKVQSDNVVLSAQLEERLKNLIENDKVYTQKNLSLADVASLLDTNTTYLSQYLNKQLDTNFSDYINSFRVIEACRIFKNNSSLKYSLDQVADMVGFSSRTTFYTTFKKNTGVTPAFFQKNILTSLLEVDEE